MFFRSKQKLTKMPGAEVADKRMLAEKTKSRISGIMFDTDHERVSKMSAEKLRIQMENVRSSADGKNVCHM